MQLNAVVSWVLPDPEADIPTCGRQKRIFKFISIRVPRFEGFEELKSAVSLSRLRVIEAACFASRRIQLVIVIQDQGFCLEWPE